MVLTDKIKSVLLRVIQGSGKVKPVLKFGCKYSDIAEWINSLIAEGLCEINDVDKLVLTKLGEQMNGKLGREFKKKRKTKK